MPHHPLEVVVSRPDDRGELRSVGLSLPLTPQLRREIGQHARLTGEPAVRVSTGVFGCGHTEYPVVPDLVVEIEVEAAVVEWTHRRCPRVHRLRPDLTVDDLAT